jgi:hypothetical protein
MSFESVLETRILEAVGSQVSNRVKPGGVFDEDVVYPLVVYYRASTDRGERTLNGDKTIDVAEFNVTVFGNVYSQVCSLADTVDTSLDNYQTAGLWYTVNNIADVSPAWDGQQIRYERELTVHALKIAV